jgi:hypothetical protein
MPGLLQIISGSEPFGDFKSNEVKESVSSSSKVSRGVDGEKESIGGNTDVEKTNSSLQQAANIQYIENRYLHLRFGVKRNFPRTN